MATESEGEEEVKQAGCPELIVDDNLWEMAKKAAWSVSSFKQGNGVLSLTDGNLDTYWQSDGAQPHLVNIQFQKKVKLQLLVLYVDFKLDESYTPSKISIRAGDGFHNLKEVKMMELEKPIGWIHIPLSGSDPRNAYVECGRLITRQIIKLYLDGAVVDDAKEVEPCRQPCVGVQSYGVIREAWSDEHQKGLSNRETFIHTFMLQIAVLSNHLNGRDTHIRQIRVYGPRPNPVPHQPFHFTSKEFTMYSSVR